MIDVKNIIVEKNYTIFDKKLADLEDLTGRVFGSNKVIGFLGWKKGKMGVIRYWRCVCTCGNIVNVRHEALLLGKSSSCKKCGYKKAAITHSKKVIINGKETTVTQLAKELGVSRQCVLYRLEKGKDIYAEYKRGRPFGSVDINPRKQYEKKK